MSPGGRRRQRKVAGLTCGQIVLLLIFMVVLFMSVALVLGYNLGVFDRFVMPRPSSFPPTLMQDPQDNTLVPDGLVALTPSSEDTQTSISATLPNPTSGTPTSLANLSTPATATPAPTITLTPPADVCAQLDLRFLNATSNIATWRLQNTSGEELAITRIEIAWPKSNDAIFNAFLNGVVIWSGEDLFPPSFITTWIGEPQDRVIGALSRLELFFGTAAASSGYDLTLRFDNGCEVAHSN